VREVGLLSDSCRETTVGGEAVIRKSVAIDTVRSTNTVKPWVLVDKLQVVRL